MFEYLSLLFIFTIIPLVILWAWKFKLLYQYIPVFFLAVIGAIIFGMPWDYISIKNNLWTFTPSKIIGVWFFGLPLEEWLFFIFVTSLFTTITLLLWKKYGVEN